MPQLAPYLGLDPTTFNAYIEAARQGQDLSPLDPSLQTIIQERQGLPNVSGETWLGDFMGSPLAPFTVPLMALGAGELGAAGWNALASLGAGAGETGIGGSSIPFLTDASGNVAQQVAINPLTGAAMPGAGLSASQLAQMIPALTEAGTAAEGAPSGATGGGAGAGGGSNIMQMLQRLGLLQQLMGLFSGRGGGGVPGGGAGGTSLPPSAVSGSSAQGLSPQQLAALTATQSEAHKGLAPWYEARSTGKALPGGGISGPEWEGMQMANQYYNA
jgi:hypothetical protein